MKVHLVHNAGHSVRVVTAANPLLEAHPNKERADIGESNVGEIPAVENAIEQSLMAVQTGPRASQRSWLPGQDLNPQPSG